MPSVVVLKNSQWHDVNSSMEVANKFIRNGNEIRRSLRRINSLTRCDINDPTVLSLNKQNYRDLNRTYNKSLANIYQLDDLPET